MGVLKVRVGDAWEVVGGDVSEMLVSDVDPYVISPTATEELWYSPVVKQLFARVNNAWQPAVINEVMVSRNDPAGVNPEVELWYDVDATPSTPATKPVAIDEVWVGGQEPIKPGVELWYDTAATVSQTDVVYKDVTAENLTINPGVIQFPNVADVPKINYYADDFGVGIEGGTQTIFASSRVRFRIGTQVTPGDFITIPEVASVDVNGFVAGGVWVPTLKVLTANLVVGHWYEVATVDYHRTVRFRIGVISGGKPTRSQSLDGLAALYADEGEGESLYSGYINLYGHIKGKMANNKLFDSIGVGPTKLWIRCVQAATGAQVGIEAYDTASGAKKTLSFADGGTAPGVWDSVAL